MLAHTETARALWQKFLIFAGAIFYLLLFQHGIHGDGSVRLEALMLLIREGKFLPTGYSIVGPLISSPLLLLGHFVKDEHWWISRFNTFLFFGMLIYLYREWTKIWPAERVRTAVLMLLCATMFPKHVTDYYSEVFSACAMAVAIWQFQKGRFAVPISLALLSVWNTPGTSIGGALVLVYFGLQRRQLRYFLLAPFLFLGIFAENFLKFGEFFPNAYLAATDATTLLPYAKGPGFSYPLFFGVLGILFSAGKGLLFFSPGLLALFHPRVWQPKIDGHKFIVASSLYLLGLLLVFGRWFSWTGDSFWGPRFFLYSSILAVYLFDALKSFADLSRSWKIFCFFALALSFWVSCQGVLYGRDFQEDCYREGLNLAFMCHFVPEYSVLWRPFVVWPGLHGRQVAYFIYFLLVAITVLWQPARENLRWAWATIRAVLQNQLTSAWKI